MGEQRYQSITTLESWCCEYKSGNRKLTLTPHHPVLEDEHFKALSNPNLERGVATQVGVSTVFENNLTQVLKVLRITQARASPLRLSFERVWWGSTPDPAGETQLERLIGADMEHGVVSQR